jgi:exodeoxyribonuclease VII large subunit
MGFRPENGAQVTARGRISLYEPRGDYQFIIDSMQEAGEGLLQRQFEELKKKLQAEGLFDAGLKKTLPRYPGRIGLVTSPSGAAVRDLIHVLGRRWPAAQLRLYPVPVQGAEAPAAIRDAIAAANRHGWADVLIIGRGGGSLEDLWAFNDEGVARAVAASAIPVVSAVGHETDFSISDFVADLRAPTPSAAAETATPDQAALLESLQRAQRQLTYRMESRLQQSAQKLDHSAHRLQQRHPSRRLDEQQRLLDTLSARLNRQAEGALVSRSLRLDTLAKRLGAHRPDRKLAELGERLGNLQSALERRVQDVLRTRQEHLGHLARTLNAVSPLQTIGRGYAVLTAAETGEVVSRVAQVGKGDEVTAQLSDGFVDLSVNRTRKS